MNEELERYVAELAAIVRKSDYQALREMIKMLVLIGVWDKELTDKILK